MATRPRLAWLTLIGFVLLLDGGVAFGQGCPALVGQWSFWDNLTVAVSGTTACFGGYAGNPPSTLLVANVANPSLPTVMAALALPGEGVVDIAVAEPQLCVVANGDAGVRVIDVSTPSAPVETGFYDTPGDAFKIAVAGSLAFVPDQFAGLQVIDFGGDEPPHLVGSYVEHSVYDVAVAGAYAYVTAYPPSLRVIDISTPSAPVEVGSLDNADYHGSVAVEGSHAYVLTGEFEGALRVIDVSEPTAPVQVGDFDAFGVNCLTVAGNRVYLGQNQNNLSGRLQVIDVSNPSAPSSLGWGTTASCCPTDIVVTGDHVYLAENDGLAVLDVSEPTAPTAVGSFATYGIVNGVALSGQYAFVAQGSASMVVDVSDPAAPYPVVAFGPWARDVAVQDGYAFLTAELALRVVDVSIPTAPVEVGSCAVPASAAAPAIALEGSHAYVASDGFGLRIIDVSDPSAPVEVGSYDTLDNAYHVAIDGALAYVAGSSGLHVIDVSDPSAPVEICLHATPAIATAVASPYAYVAVSSSLLVLDISNPSAPVEIGSYPSGALNVTVTGSYAYLSGYAGLRLLDVSNPSTPFEVGLYPGWTSDVAVAGAHAFVAHEWDYAVLTRCELFADGFESGDTLVWGTTVP